MADPFRSARLLYRAVESPDDDVLFQRITADAISWQNSNASLKRPQSRKDAAEYQRVVTHDVLVGLVIVIPPSTAIGTIFLKPMKFFQHRNSEIGVDILGEYQGQGYGTEAISWILDWAFDVAGLHRVTVRAFEWNYGARKLYERLGFKHEGTSREELWHNGRFWDGYSYALLDREWKDIKANKDKNKP